MKKVFLIVLFFYGTLSQASSTTFYDAINGTELVFSATSRYEKLTVDELNPLDEVGYSFFTFQSEKYEELRKGEIHNRFKRRALEASFKQKADSLAKKRYMGFISEKNYYRNPEYNGYVVDRISLTPISYLGNTLTFKFSVSLILKGVVDVNFGAEEIYFLNLEDFSVLPARAIHGKVDHNALRKALVEKWREIQSELPGHDWSPIQERVSDKEEEFYGHEEEEPVQKLNNFYTDSLISYALRKADLKKAEITFTGAGVLVGLKDAIPWFSGDAQLQVQLHLEAHEAKKALRNFEPYQALQKATKSSPAKLAVDPYDFFLEARHLRLSEYHCNLLRIEDTEISAIERYVKNNPTDSQYIHKINYKDGRAMHIDGGTRHDIATYDSIIWKDDKVHAAIRQKADRNYDNGSGYESNRYLQLQARDGSGNTKWYLNTENGFYMQEYCYFKDKVARYRYAILSHGGLLNHYDQKPYWFDIAEKGLCDENGLCAKVDERGRPVVEFKKYFAYDSGKLVQILGERESSTLYYYDDEDRLSEIIKTGSSPELQKYYYKGGERLPYRIETPRPHQRESLNAYYILYRR